MKVKIYNVTGKSKEEIEIQDIEVVDSESIINQYLKVYFSNQAQGTSKVKTRSEVRGGGKKPWRQKGTGNARAGSIRSPLWVGGGVIHGPSPKTRVYKLNSKFRKKAFIAAFGMKLKNEKIAGFEKWGDEYSTKNAKTISKLVSDDKTLVIHTGSDNVYRSFRNLKDIEVKPINDVNPYDLLNCEYILVEKDAVKLLEEKVK